MISVPIRNMQLGKFDVVHGMAGYRMKYWRRTFPTFEGGRGSWTFRDKHSIKVEKSHPRQVPIVELGIYYRFSFSFSLWFTFSRTRPTHLVVPSKKRTWSATPPDRYTNYSPTRGPETPKRKNKTVPPKITYPLVPALHRYSNPQSKSRAH